MPEPFLAEIRIMSFNYAPRGWAQCNGQLLPINQNQALFSLLGTTYGGDGQVNFALPDLRGRVPMHFGAGHTQGERAGERAHSLSLQELSGHTHIMTATTDGATQPTAAGALLATPDAVTFGNVYASPSALEAMAPGAVGNVGGSQPHNNMQPYLTLMYAIALQGVFPSRN